MLNEIKLIGICFFASFVDIFFVHLTKSIISGMQTLPKIFLTVVATIFIVLFVIATLKFMVGRFI